MIRNWIKSQPAHIVLIAINVAVFAIQSLLLVLSSLFKLRIDLFQSLFSLPSHFSEFILRPWSLFSYMYLHGNFMHLFWNMLFLFFLGKIFEQTFGRRTTFQMYHIGGLFAGLIYFISYQVFPLFQGLDNHVLVGASGAIYALVAGICLARPKMQIALFGVIKIPLILLLIFYLLSDLSNFLSSNTGGHLTHIAGAGFGIWFALKMNKGVNILLPVARFFDKFKWKNKRKTNMKVVYNKKVKSMNDDEYNYTQKANEQKLNEILDKISKSGYDSLSKSEKDFLNFMSSHGK